MFFQIFDEKKECRGVYSNGELKFNSDFRDKEYKRTWRYFDYFSDCDFEYASLYCRGKTLSQICPPHLKEEWAKQSSKFRAFVNSFREAKINLNEICFFDLLPENFLKQYCEIKNKITQYIFENVAKPADYDYLLSLTKLYSKIRKNKLNIINDVEEIKDKRFSSFVDYDIAGTKTGRTKLYKNSFPILTLKKDYRSIIKPNNDLFVELDYNAAEVRVFLGLLGLNQPQEDIHEWNRKTIFNKVGTFTRQEAKKDFFAWFYNSYERDNDVPLTWKELDKTYDREKVIQKFWNGEKITTPFGDEIKADKEHALSYLIQGTTARLVLGKVIEINNLIKVKKTLTSFIIHDSLVLDYNEEDLNLLNKIIQSFKQTKLGNFMVKVSIGKNFGELNKCYIR